MDGGKDRPVGSSWQLGAASQKGSVPTLFMLTDEGKEREQEFLIEQRLLCPPTLPLPPPRKAQPLLINFSMKQPVTACGSAGPATRPGWEGCQAGSGSPDPGPCHVPHWGITSARSPGKAHWGSEATPCSTDRPPGDQRGKGTCSRTQQIRE